MVSTKSGEVQYSICAFAGFAAWAAAAHLADGITVRQAVSGESVALLIALGGIALAGIAGALPRILYLGGRPV